MLVVGPTGNRVRLPAAPGRTYPGYGIVVQRSLFDADAAARRDRRGRGVLRRPRRRTHRRGRSPRRVLAVVDDAAARRRDHRRRRRDEPRRRGRGPRGSPPCALGVRGSHLPRRARWRSRTSCCGHRIAVRRFRATAGCFPPAAGRANVGLGIGVLADRTAGRRADARPRRLPRARVAGRRSWRSRDRRARRRGRSVHGSRWDSWARSPHAIACFLVGDAAGLVNPLQGEGIAQAMDSGRAAAEAILGGVDQAPDRLPGPLGSCTTALPVDDGVRCTGRCSGRPTLVAAVTRGLTSPGVGRSLAGGWSITWNDLLDGAPREPGHGRRHRVAGLGRVLTARSADRRWIREHVGARSRP